MHDGLLTTKEAAARLRVSEGAIRRWIAERRIPFVKVGPARLDAIGRDGRAVRLRQSVLDALVEDVTAAPGGEAIILEPRTRRI